MENKFKVGDRVRIAVDTLPGCYVVLLERGDAGYVVGYDAKEDLVKVRFDGLLRGPRIKSDYLEIDLEADKGYDPKTAFLSELKGLLEKYDAEIGAYSDNSEPVSMEIHIGDTSIAFYEGSNIVTITSDNIMNYEKE